MQRRSERENLEDIRKRRRGAWQTLISRNYKSIYRFMAYLTADTSLAEDLTQETFASAWAKIDRFKGRASLQTWLHRIAYNKFVDSKRDMERRAASITGWGSDRHEVREASNPLSRLMADEHSALLYEAMRRLESSEYIVIVLHYIQGLSFREMAKVLEEPVGTVKWQTSHALKRLRGFLTGRV
ncbi:MAG: RNA polymerase sigma factor [Planctomycetota bacterium]